MSTAWVLQSERVLTESGLVPATIVVSGGRIESVTPGRRRFDRETTRTIDAGDGVVMPGVVDAHVHVNEPGRTDWEGFRSAGTGGRRGWGDHPRRHAAQQHAGHHQRGRGRRQGRPPDDQSARMSASGVG